MADSVRAQLYLSLDIAEAARLSSLLDTPHLACVRLHIADDSAVDVAATCRALCHERNIPLLIAGPDDAAVAVARGAEADGVHLTGSPKAAPWARRELGEDIIVGIDPGPSRHETLIAAETGADYVSLSPEWDAEDALPAELTWWAAMIETPMVVENARSAARAGMLANVAEFIATGADEAADVAAVLPAT